MGGCVGRKSTQFGSESSVNNETPPREGFAVAYCITVADVDRSARFYETGFGARIVATNTLR